MYKGSKDDNSYWTFGPGTNGELILEVQENNLASYFNDRGWWYTQHNTIGMDKAIFIHLKPVAGEEETRIKLVCEAS